MFIVVVQRATRHVVSSCAGVNRDAATPLLSGYNVYAGVGGYFRCAGVRNTREDDRTGLHVDGNANDLRAVQTWLGKGTVFFWWLNNTWPKPVSHVHSREMVPILLAQGVGRARTMCEAEPARRCMPADSPLDPLVASTREEFAARAGDGGQLLAPGSCATLCDLKSLLPARGALSNFFPQRYSWWEEKDDSTDPTPGLYLTTNGPATLHRGPILREPGVVECAEESKTATSPRVITDAQITFGSFPNDPKNRLNIYGSN